MDANFATHSFRWEARSTIRAAALLSIRAKSESVYAVELMASIGPIEPVLRANFNSYLFHSDTASVHFATDII